MLRDFGWVTVVDLTVSLLGVLLVLPAVLVLAERGSRCGSRAPRRPRLRRRARGGAPGRRERAAVARRARAAAPPGASRYGWFVGVVLVCW